MLATMPEPYNIKWKFNEAHCSGVYVLHWLSQPRSKNKNGPSHSKTWQVSSPNGADHLVSEDSPSVGSVRTPSSVPRMHSNTQTPDQSTHIADHQCVGHCQRDQAIMCATASMDNDAPLQERLSEVYNAVNSQRCTNVEPLTGLTDKRIPASLS